MDTPQERRLLTQRGHWAVIYEALGRPEPCWQVFQRISLIVKKLSEKFTAPHIALWFEFLIRLILNIFVKKGTSCAFCGRGSASASSVNCEWHSIDSKIPRMIPMNTKALLPAIASTLIALSSNAGAAVVTFDTLVTGATSFGYDGDGDGINDVVFSTTDPSGFNTFGPGPNMSYINEPGIEGTTLLSPDLRVDFLNGATGSLGFGFAMSSVIGGAPTSMTFSIFDAADSLMASTTVDANFTLTPGGRSSFPEGLVSLAFAGTASYATFDFNPTNALRYIVDNFSGTFGSTEQVPEPATVALAALGLAGLGWSRRRRAS